MSNLTKHHNYDVAIIGGGPAGQAAAARTTAFGLSTCTLDEQQRPGGQILRQPPTQFKVNNWLSGRVYAPLQAQITATQANDDLNWYGGHSALSIMPASGGDTGFRIACTGHRASLISARHVLIAGGCYDMPVPLPGWTLPGAMTAGGVQAFVKSQQIAPGNRFVLYGSHPLQLLVGLQLLEAGADVAAILFPQSFKALASIILRSSPLALRNIWPLLDAAHAYRTLRARKVPILFGAAVRSIIGTQHVEAAQAEVDGQLREWACDATASCFGFLPQSDLVRAAGAAVRWSAPAGGWEAKHGLWMESSVNGLFVAGETTGVAGAQVAMLEGEIAGLGVAIAAGKLTPDAANHQAKTARAALHKMQPFVELLRKVASPVAYFPTPSPDTLICRCEDVSAGQIDSLLDQDIAPTSVSGLKLRSRAGMGLCQGRSCEHMLVRTLTANNGQSEDDFTGFTSRFPARPVAIADLIQD